MNKLKKALTKNKQLRVLGIDDAPFDKQHHANINLVGIICNNTRFEGMLWSRAQKDGQDATDTIIKMVSNSKFHQ
ncbi:MAG: DUF99 family protein [Cocleimonas sp.]|nr:DUF99 family protein [Cocleimonas sp.]